MGYGKIDRNKLRRLCANLELSDIQIAKRFGVTREAIRTARNRLGIKGRGRARVARLQKRRRQRKEELRCRKIYECSKALRSIRANASKLGIDIKLLPQERGRHVRIANVVCHLLKGHFIEKTLERRGTQVYAAFARPTTEGPYDILIVELPRGWMIVPYDKLPRKGTMFAVKRKTRHLGGTGRRFDWATYYYPNLDWLRAFSKNEGVVHIWPGSQREHKSAELVNPDKS